MDNRDYIAMNKEEVKLTKRIVIRSLPTHKQRLSKMEEWIENNYKRRTEIEKTNFRIGLQKFFNWLEQEPSDNG